MLVEFQLNGLVQVHVFKWPVEVYKNQIKNLWQNLKVDTTTISYCLMICVAANTGSTKDWFRGLWIKRCKTNEFPSPKLRAVCVYCRLRHRTHTVATHVKMYSYFLSFLLLWLLPITDGCHRTTNPLGHSPFRICNLSQSGWFLHPSVTWGWMPQWGASQWVRWSSFTPSSSTTPQSLTHSLNHRVCRIYASMSDVVGIPVSMSVL